MKSDAQAVRRSSLVGTVVLYTLVTVAAMVVPLVFLALKVPLIDWSGERQTCFHWFAFWGSLGIIAIGYIEIRKRSSRGFAEYLPIILWALVSLHFLSIMTLHPEKSGDYLDYSRAARTVLAGGSPYERGTEKWPYSTYLYPPVQAQVMAGLYSAIKGSAELCGVNTVRLDPWNAVFYLFQCVQLLLIVATYWLAYLFARSLGVGRIAAAVIVSAVLVFNNPLWDMLRWNQVGLWVVDSILLAVLLLRYHPFLSGLAIAVGTHIKLFPVILLLPWTLGRRWKVLLGSFVGGTAIAVLLPANWADGFHLYREFLNYHASYTPYRGGFGNASLYALVHLIVQPAHHIPNIDPSALEGIVRALTKVISLVILGWFGVRFVQREKAYSRLVQRDSGESQSGWGFCFRFAGHAMDAVALAVLVSPTLFPHYWVMSIPVLLWAIAVRGAAKPWHVGVAGFLLLCLPTARVAVFAYHSVAGLVMLVVLTAPQKITVPLESAEGRLAQLLRT